MQKYSLRVIFINASNSTYLNCQELIRIKFTLRRGHIKRSQYYLLYLQFPAVFEISSKGLKKKNENYYRSYAIITLLMCRIILVQALTKLKSLINSYSFKEVTQILKDFETNIS